MTHLVKATCCYSQEKIGTATLQQVDYFPLKNIFSSLIHYKPQVQLTCVWKDEK